MTYLEIVNDVLARLRESPVTAWNQTTYSTLIGTFVNDSKRQVEDAFNWSALRTVISVTTAAGTSTYTLTGSGVKARIAEVNDVTNKYRLRNMPISMILDVQQLTTQTNSNPGYYAFNGTSGGDLVVELNPTPNGIYTIKFNCYVPQATLISSSTTLTVPYEPVVAGAYARALVERGEDGGLSSSEAYALYKSILADAISLESARFIENDCFVSV